MELKFIKLLDFESDYISNKIVGDTSLSRVASNKREIVVPILWINVFQNNVLSQAKIIFCTIYISYREMIADNGIIDKSGLTPK